MTLEHVKTLINLGLTPNQARIYVALVQSGNSTAAEISRNTELARETIYRTMSSLENVGVIERKLTKPVIFEAVNPKEAVSILLKNQTEETLKNEEKSLSLIEKLENSKFVRTRTVKTSQQKPTLTLISGKKSFSRNVNEAVNMAQETFDGITTPQNFRTGMILGAEGFKNAISRRVRFRHIVSKTERDLANIGDKFLRKNDFWQVRYSLNPLPVDSIIIDGKEVFVEVSFSKENVCYLRSTAPGIIAMAQNYFETVWHESQSSNYTSEVITH